MLSRRVPFARGPVQIQPAMASRPHARLPGRLVGDVRDLRSVRQESPTTSNSPASPDSASTAVPAVPARSAPSRPWRQAALLLAGAAQLITISAPLSADPVATTWASLLLAIAPAPLALAAFCAPAPVSLLAAVAGVAVLVAGIAGEIRHIGLWFLPALVALAIGTVELWREQSQPGRPASAS